MISKPRMAIAALVLVAFIATFTVRVVSGPPLLAPAPTTGQNAPALVREVKAPSISVRSDSRVRIADDPAGDRNQNSPLFIRGGQGGLDVPLAIPAAGSPGPAPGGPAPMGNDPFGTPGSLGAVNPLPGGKEDAAAGRIVEGFGVILKWNEKKDCIWGFSKASGNWTKQELDPPGLEQPLASFSVGAVQNGSTVYAYSGQSNRWDVLRLPKNRRPKILLGRSLIAVVDGSDVHSFGGQSARWVALRLPEGHQPEISVSADLVLVNDGPVVHTFAASMGRWTSPDGNDAGDGQESGQRSAVSSQQNSTLPTPAREVPPVDSELESADQSNTKALQQQFDAKEKRAAGLASELRQLQSNGDVAESRLDELKAALRRVVAEAFAIRQQLHRAELAQLQQRLQRMQQTLAARDRIQQQIVDRRVNDLINPDSRWEDRQKTAPKEPIPATTSKEGVKSLNPETAPKRVDARTPQIGSLPQSTAGIPEATNPVRNSADFLRDYRDMNSSLRNSRKAVDELDSAVKLGKGDQTRLERAKAALREYQQKYDFVKAEFDAQLRLLELEAKDAESEVAFAEQQSHWGQILYRKGGIQQSELGQLTRNIQIAKLRLDKATTAVEFYRSMDPDASKKISEAHATTKQNLATLMQAMRKYQEQHGHFPPAIVQKGTGKWLHSWRLELLPYLGEQALYDEYRFDESCKSDQNKRVLARMPAVFRSPLDATDSTNSSYFALVMPGFDPNAKYPGPGALVQPAKSAPASEVAGGAVEPSYRYGTFFARPEGTRPKDIIDALDHTVVLVEAKRNEPWTHPGDINVFVHPLPKLGGWFPKGWHAAFADGTVKFISSDNDEATLRAIFSIGGGENVQPKLVEPAARDESE